MATRVKRVRVKTARVKHIEAEVKPVVRLEARKPKTTYVRRELGDGFFMVTYYFRRGPYGELIAEDFGRATHFERAVYDENGTFVGSTIGQITKMVF